MDPIYPAAVTILALLVGFSTAAIVGRLRTKHGINPPLTTGPDEFQRAFRVQQNTTENLVLFLPALWLYAWFVSPVWAAGIGLVWLLARVGYILGYLASAKNRIPGFLISIIALAILLIGALIGIGKALIA